MSRARRPQVAILDLGMPCLDGYGMTRELRPPPETAYVVLVALTGRGPAIDRRRMAEAGFDLLYAKPVDPDAIEALLAALPACRRRTRSACEPEPRYDRLAFGAAHGRSSAKTEAKRSPPTMGDITELLARARGGDAAAHGALFTRVYCELATIARARLRDSSSLTQLDPQALVHEAYLRLVERQPLPGGDRRHFYAYASSVMRSIVVDYVRERRALKRGGADERVTLSTLDSDAAAGTAGPDIEQLDAALRDLARVDARSHRVVELKYFGGLSFEEIADVLELSPATVKRDWQKARAFLYANVGA